MYDPDPKLGTKSTSLSSPIALSTTIPKFIPLENISKEKDHFTIDPKEFVKYSMISKILYVVHSHYMQDCKPSEHDKNNSKAIGIPYLIVSYPEKKEYIYDPS